MKRRQQINNRQWRRIAEAMNMNNNMHSFTATLETSVDGTNGHRVNLQQKNAAGSQLHVHDVHDVQCTRATTTL